MAAIFTQPQTIIQPFCSTGDKSLPPATSSSTVANQVDGFPPAQANTQSSGGLPVLRKEMNGAFNLYTQHALWAQVGGQYTFDTAIATAGGYNKGAILYYSGPIPGSATNINCYLVSTKDNNTDNFIATPSLIGTNWILASTLDIVNTNVSGQLDHLYSVTYYPNGRCTAIVNGLSTIQSTISGQDVAQFTGFDMQQPASIDCTKILPIPFISILNASIQNIYSPPYELFMSWQPVVNSISDVKARGLTLLGVPHAQQPVLQQLVVEITGTWK